MPASASVGVSGGSATDPPERLFPPFSRVPWFSPTVSRCCARLQLMRVVIAVPNPEREPATRALWEELMARAVPFPVQVTGVVELTADWVNRGCQNDMPEIAEALATYRHRSNTGRICLGHALFARPCDVQLGILLHEVVHLRLFEGRLHKNFLASLDVEAREGGREVLGDGVFPIVRMHFAFALLKLVTEVAVDKFMATQHPWVSTDYWEARCRAFYSDGARSIAADEDVTSSLRPYAALYQHVALELGLMVLPAGRAKQELFARRDDYAGAIAAATVDRESEAWLKEWGTNVLNCDPIPTQPDECAYDEVCERILALPDE